MAEKAKLEIGSKEKVAYDLMNQIATYEADHNKERWLKPDPRTYFLKLFNQCVRASYPDADTGYIFSNE